MLSSYKLNMHENNYNIIKGFPWMSFTCNFCIVSELENVPFITDEIKYNGVISFINNWD